MHDTNTPPSSERGQLTAEQRAALLRPLNPKRVHTQQGLAHLPAWDVLAHLTRVFGTEGWDKHVLQLDLLSEREVNGKWVCTYRAMVRLVIRDVQGRVVKVLEDVACGTNMPQPQLGEAHDLASKSAVSYAVKRCAKDLGDGFGLSLYNGGSLAPVVVSSVAYAQPHVDEARLPEVLGDAEPALVPGEDVQPPAQPEPTPAQRPVRGSLADAVREGVVFGHELRAAAEADERAASARTFHDGWADPADDMDPAPVVMIARRDAQSRALRVLQGDASALREAWAQSGLAGHPNLSPEQLERLLAVSRAMMGADA